MTQKDREIQHRLRILKHAEETGHVGRTCRYFGIGNVSFCLKILNILIEGFIQGLPMGCEVRVAGLLSDTRRSP